MHDVILISSFWIEQVILYIAIFVFFLKSANIPFYLKKEKKMVSRIEVVETPVSDIVGCDHENK